VLLSAEFEDEKDSYNCQSDKNEYCWLHGEVLGFCCEDKTTNREIEK
jgi:hypothetical protein